MQQVNHPEGKKRATHVTVSRVDDAYSHRVQISQSNTTWKQKAVAHIYFSETDFQK